MGSWRNRFGFGVSVLLAGSAMVLFSGCAQGFGDPCELDPNSPDAAVATCGQNDGPARSCVVDNQIQCDTGACGRFQGSEPFCTLICTDDSDCGDAGTCLEFVFQSGVKYCALNSLL